MKRIGTIACGTSIAALMLAAGVGLAATKPRQNQNPLFPRGPSPTEVQAPPAPIEPAVAVPSTVRLKSEAVVRGEVVRLSDLIEGIDAKQDIPMFRAPALGEIGTIQATRVIAAAAENGITGVDTNDLTAVIVRRSGHIVPQDQLFDLIRDALARRYGLPADTELVADKNNKAMIVEAEARRSPEIASLAFDSRLSRFEVSFTVPGSGITAKTPYRLGGSLGDSIRVPIINRQLVKGDAIGPNDYSVETRRRSEFFGEGLVDPAKVTGSIARHGMRAGDIVAASDIAKAEWVEKGSLVSIVYETAGISLATKGRAIGGGSEGDTITVENLQSKRSLEGVIIGPGKVSVQNKTAQSGGSRTAPEKTVPEKTLPERTLPEKTSLDSTIAQPTRTALAGELLR